LNSGGSRSADWAVVVVAASIGGAYALDALGLRSLARAALIPVYPVLLAVLSIAGGFHSASGDWRVMALTALVSVGLWLGIFEGWRRLRARNRS
jgi:hypothetical protein